MRILSARGLADGPLDAAAGFHARVVPAVREAIAGADLVCIVFDPADHTHRAWRVAAVQALAREAAPGRVNAISAGPVKTASARGIPGFSSMVEMFGERAPLKDTFNAKDVAQLAVFLASDGAKANTAETIFVDNGYHAMGM